MRSTFRLICTLILFAGWVLAASAIYVIRLPDGFIGLLPKDRLGFVDTYVDIRGWTPADAAQHPDLIKRLVEAKKIDWLSSIVGLPQQQGDRTMQDILAHLTAPATQPAKAHAKPLNPHK